MPCSRDRDFTIQSYSQTETRQNLHVEEGQTGVAALAGCCSLLLLQQLFSQKKPNRTTITHSSPLPPPPPTSRGSNRPLIRYEERCVVWHLPEIPLINNSLPPTHFSKQTHNQDSFSLSLQKQKKKHNLLLLLVVVSLLLLLVSGSVTGNTHSPSNHEGSFWVPGADNLSAKSTRFQKQTDSMMHGWVGRSR